MGSAAFHAPLHSTQNPFRAFFPINEHHGGTYYGQKIFQKKSLLCAKKSINKNDDSGIEAEYESMFKLNENDEMKEMRSKLVTESIAPWRGLRLFLYGSAASGAFVGGLITLSRFVAASKGLTGEDVDMNTEYLNLAIDFGAAIACIILAKIDYDKGLELNTKVETKLERKKEQEKIKEQMRSREQNILLKLKLNIQVSTTG